MENLNYNEIQYLSDTELQQTEGGFIWPTLAGAGISLLISEWESTKKAARDLWNFEFNPPN